MHYEWGCHEYNVLCSCTCPQDTRTSPRKAINITKGCWLSHQAFTQADAGDLPSANLPVEQSHSTGRNSNITSEERRSKLYGSKLGELDREFLHYKRTIYTKRKLNQTDETEQQNKHRENTTIQPSAQHVQHK